MSLKRNIVANLAGGAWIAALTLAITPLQIHLLGMEAYGVIGLISVLQVALGAMDLGLSATVTQRVASDRSAGHADSAAIAASTATLYWLVALALGASIWIAAEWIAQTWLTAQSLSPAILQRSIETIALYLALRWPVALYSGLLAGVQRMDVLNYIKAGSISIRMLGGIAVLLISPDLLAFLNWMAISAVVEVLAYALVAYRLLPWLRFSWRISFQTLRGVWRFSAGLNLIALSAVVLTQLDRVVISKFLTLEVLGYYSLAFSVVSGLSMIHSAVNAAALPNLAALAGQRDRLLARYDQTAALTARVAALPCLAVAWFSQDILTLWVGAPVAEGASVATSILMAGLLFNAMMSVATTACMAIGRPWAVVRLNAVALAGYVPLLLLLTQSLGMVGAAWSWLALNAFFFFFGLPALLGAIGRPDPARVLLRTLKEDGPLLATVLFGAAKCLTIVMAPWLAWPALLLATLAYSVLSYPYLRSLARSVTR